MVPQGKKVSAMLFGMHIFEIRFSLTVRINDMNPNIIRSKQRDTHYTFTCIYNLVINIKKIELYIYIYICTQSACELACYFCYLIWSCGESEWGSSSSSYWNTKSKPTKKKLKRNSGTDMRMSSMAVELKIYKPIAVYT